jgi:hypothetical protein
MSQIITGERKFFLADSPEPVLTLRIFSPLQPENADPSSRYEITGSGRDETGEVPGVDTIDSLIACLALVGTKIDGLNESVFDNNLRWDAWVEGDRSQGLPTISDHWPYRDLYRKYVP